MVWRLAKNSSDTPPENQHKSNTITDGEFHHEELRKANNQMDKDGAETGGLYSCINHKKNPNPENMPWTKQYQ